MTAAADQTSPLSIDQAVGLLDRAAAVHETRQEDSAGKDAREAAHVAAVSDGNEDAITVGADDADTSRSAADSDDASTVDAGKESETPEASAAGVRRQPPSHWNAEERAIFEKQPAEVQEAILAQEGKRESVLQRARLDAASAEQAARTRETELGRRVQAIDALLQPAFRTFQTRWASVDWSDLPDRIGADQTLKLRAQFENEQAMIRGLVQEQENAEAERHRSFVAHESERLKTEAPDLVDPRDGKTRVQALAHFLVSEGFPAERLSMMSAKEAAIAYDAMRWREAEARAKAASKQTAQRKEIARTPAAAVRPTASQAPRTPQSKADDAMRRLMKSGRIDDAVAVLNARSP